MPLNPGTASLLIDEWRDRATSMRDSIMQWEADLPTAAYDSAAGIIREKAEAYEECANALEALI